MQQTKALLQLVLLEIYVIPNLEPTQVGYKII